MFANIRVFVIVVLMDKKAKIESAFYVFLLGVFFLVASYFVQENISNIELWVGEFQFLGFFIYSFFGFLTTVIAPISSVPLVPIASNLWGWEIASILNVVSWTTGSYIAFLLAARFGRPIIKRFVSLEKIDKLEHLIPKEHVFWTVVLLRIIVPVDILSYALGLFSKVRMKDYMMATVVGITPFAIMFSYVGEIEFKYQIFIFVGFFISMFLWFFVRGIINVARGEK